MRTAYVNFEEKPIIDDVDGEIVTHHASGLGSARVVLGDDDVLRVNNKPVLALVHHLQMAGSEISPEELEYEIIKGDSLLNASLAPFLLNNPSFVPKHWRPQLERDGLTQIGAGGGILWWGTRIRQKSSGRVSIPLLGMLEGTITLTALDMGRVIGRRASAILA